MGRASFAAKESFSNIDASSGMSGAVQQLKILLEGVEMTEKQLSEVYRFCPDKVVLFIYSHIWVFCVCDFYFKFCSLSFLS